MASEANYVRVDVEQQQVVMDGVPPLPEGPPSLPGPAEPNAMHHAQQPRPALPRTQLLCTVRALLKKMRKSVLVGDRVKVGSIDWTSGRGQVEDVLPRRSVLVNPAVANVDHVVLLFGLTNPPVSKDGYISEVLFFMKLYGCGV
jgi:putative ribosome biogenesis GTPase RsgA